MAGLLARSISLKLLLLGIPKGSSLSVKAADNRPTERFYSPWNRCNIRGNNEASSAEFECEASGVYSLWGKRFERYNI